MTNKAPTAQQCHALTTYFINKYTDVMESKPLVNRNKAKAGFSGLLMDYTPTQARELIDYYIEHWDRPSITWFIYNYELVDEALTERAVEEKKIEQRRLATKERLEQWRNRWEK